MQCFKQVSTPRATDRVFIFNDNKIYLNAKNNIPTWQEIDFKQTLSGALYCFYRHSSSYDIFVGKRVICDSDTCKPTVLKEIPHLLNEQDFALASKAKHLAHFMKTHQFCGGCGSKVQINSAEKALYCTFCRHLSYPRIAPCIIVLIKREDQRILLARSPHFPDGVYSNVAGFVEPGESLEEAVHREVSEEVGVSIKNLRYITSQPWPFPDSLMVGFIADYAAGEIQVDNDEIEDAQWFEPSFLPIFSSKISISRWLIDIYLREIGIQSID